MRAITMAVAAAHFAVATNANSATPIAGPVDATLVSCYDGDTCHFDVTVWPGITIHTAVRLRGVDTPEIRGECDEEKLLAIEARDFVSARLESALSIRVSNIEPDKYGGRVVADITVDGHSVADLLISSGLGRAYDGGTRNGWCPSDDITQGGTW